MEGPEEGSADSRRHTGYLCIPVSFVLDGGHIAQTAGGILFQPVLFSQQDCV